MQSLMIPTCTKIYENKKYFIKYNDKYLSLPKRGKNYSYSEIIYSEKYEYPCLNNYLWKIIVKNNSFYIYHSNGLQLIVNSFDINDPFHFSINFDEKNMWNSFELDNNNIFTHNNDIYDIRIYIEETSF